MVSFGAVLEGLVEPWWRARLAQHGAFACRERSRTPAVRTLRAALELLIWTPICCELYYLWEHLFINGALQAYAAAPGDAWRDVLRQAGVQVARDGGGWHVEPHTEQLQEDVERQGLWQAATALLTNLLPPALRAAARSVSDAGALLGLLWLCMWGPACACVGAAVACRCVAVSLVLAFAAAASHMSAERGSGRHFVSSDCEV